MDFAPSELREVLGMDVKSMPGTVYAYTLHDVWKLYKNMKNDKTKSLFELNQKKLWFINQLCHSILENKKIKQNRPLWQHADDLLCRSTFELGINWEQIQNVTFTIATVQDQKTKQELVNESANEYKKLKAMVLNNNNNSNNKKNNPNKRRKINKTIFHNNKLNPKIKEILDQVYPLLSDSSENGLRSFLIHQCNENFDDANEMITNFINDI